MKHGRKSVNVMHRAGPVGLAVLMVWLPIQADTGGLGRGGREAVVRSRSLLPEKYLGSQVHLSDAYGKLPLSFEANQGQTNAKVKFISRGRGYSLFFTSSEMILVFRKSTATKTELSALEKVGGPAVVRMRL